MLTFHEQHTDQICLHMLLRLGCVEQTILFSEVSFYYVFFPHYVPPSWSGNNIMIFSFSFFFSQIKIFFENPPHKC